MKRLEFHTVMMLAGIVLLSAFLLTGPVRRYLMRGEKSCLYCALEPGRSFQLSVTTRLKPVLTKRGILKVWFKEKYDTLYAVRVLEKDPKGNVLISVTLESIVYACDPPGKVEGYEKVDYSSGSEDAVPARIGYFYALIGESFIVEINSDRMMSPVEEIQTGESVDTTGVKQKMIHSVVQAELKPFFGMSPKKAVGIGDTWTRDSTLFDIIRLYRIEMQGYLDSYDFVTDMRVRDRRDKTSFVSLAARYSGTMFSDLKTKVQKRLFTCTQKGSLDFDGDSGVMGNGKITTKLKSKIVSVARVLRSKRLTMDDLKSLLRGNVANFTVRQTFTCSEKVSDR